MGKARWIIFAAVVVLVLGGLIVYSRLSNPSTDVSNVNQNSIQTASDQNGNIGDHVFNNTKSDVVLVEYGDFQCPGCGAAHPNVKELLGEYGDDISFVFRNFPLTNIHPNARAAASAAEAAGLQGKYWEMHDLLFETQTTWQGQNPTERTDTFKDYAEQLNLDMTRFDSDFASQSVSQKINFDVAVGKKANVDSTPTFFLNGEKISEAAATGLLRGDLTEIKKLLDEKL